MTEAKQTGRTAERVRRGVAGRTAPLAVGGIATAVAVSAWAGTRDPCTLGRIKGSLFRQDYGNRTARGSAIAGARAGTEGSPQDHVALPVGHHEWRVVWQEPDSHTLGEALVRNFANRIIYIYAPGSDALASAGALTAVERGAVPLP